MCFFLQDLAEVFNKKVMFLWQGFQEIRLVFDRYIKDSLKSRIRKKRTSGKEVRYKISDATNIANISFETATISYWYEAGSNHLSWRKVCGSNEQHKQKVRLAMRPDIYLEFVAQQDPFTECKT